MQYMRGLAMPTVIIVKKILMRICVTIVIGNIKTGQHQKMSLKKQLTHCHPHSQRQLLNPKKEEDHD